MDTKRGRGIEELFGAASALPSEKRQAFIEKACGDDAELRAEVESLLGFHSEDTLLPAARDKARSAAPWPSSNRRKLALTTALAAVVVTVLGVVAHDRLERRIRHSLERRLEATLDANVRSLTDWLTRHARALEEIASIPHVQSKARDLVALTAGRDVPQSDVRRSAPHEALLRTVLPEVERHGFESVNIFSREFIAVFFTNEPAGDGVRRLNSDGARLLAPALNGETVISAPHRGGRNVYAVRDRDPVLGQYQIIFGTPIWDGETVVGVLIARIAPEPTVTQKLRTARFGNASDTFAFNATGLLVSRSRFENELEQAGLLEPSSGSLRVSLRDPGGDATQGFEPTASLAELPLTRMATSATAGYSGVDLDGYRDVRGVPVIGAWRWLPEFQIGVATETPHGDAYRALGWLRGGVGSFVAIIGVSSVLMFLSTVTFSSTRKAGDSPTTVGQYELGESIGEGGMATVYRATHSHLGRPVAIKLIKGPSEGADDEARFEREVRLVTQLNHTNTVKVLDSGRTESGALYCVMELVPGITLKELASVAGPLPPARVVWILRQAAGSLSEAHQLGIVHRDVKPTNIMICDRADAADVIKVLDFGLARPVSRDSMHITHQALLGGTPAYIAPERIRAPDTVDARSDIYALGAVGYFLLTTREIVEGSTPEEVLLKTLEAQPTCPSDIVGNVPRELESIIMRCVAKDPDERIQSASDLEETLTHLSEIYPWTQDEARTWWEEHRARTNSP